MAQFNPIFPCPASFICQFNTLHLHFQQTSISAAFCRDLPFNLRFPLFFFLMACILRSMDGCLAAFSTDFLLLIFSSFFFTPWLCPHFSLSALSPLLCCPLPWWWHKLLQYLHCTVLACTVFPNLGVSCWSLCLVTWLFSAGESTWGLQPDQLWDLDLPD